MPDLKPMLASPIEDPEKMTYPLLGSPKLDGVRCLIVNGVAVSRKLKPIPNLYVQSCLKELGEIGNLDGELIVGEPGGNDVFNRTTSGVMSRDGEPDFTYWVFDCWSRTCAFSKIDWSCKPDSPRIEVVHQTIINNAEEFLSFEEKCLEAGFEGIMLRKPLSPYKFGRSTLKEGYLLKFKRFSDAEATIIGYHAEMENTNALEKDALGHAKRSTAKAGKVAKDTLGRLDVNGCEEFPDKEFSLGLDCTNEYAKAMWDARDTLIGRRVKFRYQKAGSLDKPRFPAFIGFRDERD